MNQKSVQKLYDVRQKRPSNVELVAFKKPQKASTGITRKSGRRWRSLPRVQNQDAPGHPGYLDRHLWLCYSRGRLISETSAGLGSPHNSNVPAASCSVWAKEP